MEDHMQVRAALETSRCPEPAESSPPPAELISVAFDARTASVDLDPTKSLDKVEEEVEKKMDAVDSSSDEYTTSLLPEPRVAEDSSCLTKCCVAYRSADSGSRVTPFAIILLIVLFVIYVLNQADRLVLAVLIPSGLRCYEDFTNGNSSNATSCSPEPRGDSNDTFELNSTDCVHFDNFQQGLLTGPAFTIVYVVAGLPLAWLADTASRPLVLLIGLAFWSTMMILSGSVAVFWQLLVLRILLGVGEASYNPVVYSLLSDYFPARHRACVLSIYHYGVYLGGGFGWMSGAINATLNWRWTFRTLGIAGLVCVPMAFLALWEPKRVREKRKARRKGKSHYSIKEVFLYLVKSPTYWLLLVAGSIRNIPGYALGAWLPTFYSQVFQLQSDEYGIKAGLAVIFGGAIGSFLGGFLSDRLSAHRKGAKAFVIAVSQVLAAPSIIGVLLVPSANASFGLLVVAYITAETWLGPAAAIVQDITMPAMRAQASAVYIGVITIVASIGPVLVPAFIDFVPSFQDCDGVRYALLCVVPIFYIASAVLFWALGIVLQLKKLRKHSKTYKVFTDEQEVDDSRTEDTQSDQDVKT